MTRHHDAGLSRPHTMTPGTRDGPMPGQARTHQEDRTLVVGLSGDWELEHATPRFGTMVDEGGADPSTHAVDFDAAELKSWDSSLLVFLVQATDYCEAHDLEFRADNLPDGIARLLEMARAVPERDLGIREETLPFLAGIGAKGIAGYEAVLASVRFMGEVADSFARWVLRRFRLRWRDFWGVVQSNSAGALPIVTLIAFLIGMIISFLGAVVLRRFGAGYYVSYLVGYGVLREMGPLMTGIIMAGRTGAGFAAELGSMKIAEEIDAYRTFGISPIDHLVLPRVLGLLLMMPLLTIYAGFIGILGGLVVATSLLDVTVVQFGAGLLTAVTLSDALLGVFKGVVFGLIIGLAGCMKGLWTGGDAGAVGRSATSAVVLGITVIIAANAVIDWLAVLLDV